MRRSLLVLSLMALGWAVACPGLGQESAPRRRGRAPATTSVGFPFSGRLRGSVLLEEGDNVRYTGEYAPRGRFYGTTELVQLLQRAADRVATRVPGARLSVGELSAENGGRIDGHRSHQNGRDVDIAFYMLDASDRPYAPYGFAAFDRHGHGTAPNEALHFDDRRNYELLARLVSDPDARVQYVFVANTLKARILREATRRRASARVISRLEAVMLQPSHGHPHRNHFHVRIYCPPADRPRCEDREPYHAWYPGAPPVRALAPAASSAEDGT